MTNNHNNQTKIINHRHLLPPSRSNSTTQACAACRYQRRKCAADCILAPYFPHDHQRQFQNAHKLFGVSNITKIIRDLDPSQKDEAMRTIIYQADVRAHDPVGGCYRIIRELQRQIEFSRAELEIVLHQLTFCRTHAHNQNHHHDQILIDDIHLVDNPDDVSLYDHGLDLDLCQMAQPQEHAGEQYLLGEHENLNDGCEVAPINSWGNMNNSSPICLEVKAAVHECEEFKPLLIPAGERHEFKFEFDEPSEEALFNDGNHKALTKEDNVTFFTKEENVSYQQHNEDNDLKGAATLFTLTNCSSY
ncbi:hypothetical protein L1987_22741 [Smallanthus sonchifolius]|uniref:Uncharacterized protein n=1 Tax=Smallanthus sonchifolius TaxID=185202 RepID=A0ACB9IGA5_9ASTR|nr:hypothetical protein L1987_22741 [Smallanthus sonchifolius]